MRRLMAAIVVMAMMATGCATKKYVATEIEQSESRTQSQVQDLKRMVEETQTEIRDLARELGVKIEGLESNLEDTNRTMGEKTEANAQMIAQMGHLSFRKTLADSESYFRSDSADLSDVAKEELDKFASLIKRQNKMLHLEIQGHTDNRGEESYNFELGEKRAAAVRDHLYKKHDIPLHLMSIISLGSEQPVTDNNTRESRAQNRRVVLIVRMRMQ